MLPLPPPPTALPPPPEVNELTTRTNRLGLLQHSDQANALTASPNELLPPAKATFHRDASASWPQRSIIYRGSIRTNSRFDPGLSDGTSRPRKASTPLQAAVSTGASNHFSGSSLFPPVTLLDASRLMSRPAASRPTSQPVLGASSARSEPNVRGANCHYAQTQARSIYRNVSLYMTY